MKVIEYFIGGVLAVILLLALACLSGLLVWPLWNWLMPAIFGLPKISFLQALGLNVLCTLLFKSFSSGSDK